MRSLALAAVLAPLALLAAGCGGSGGGAPASDTTAAGPSDPAAPIPPALPPPLPPPPRPPEPPPPPPPEPGAFELTTAGAYCSAELPLAPGVLLEWAMSSDATMYEIFRDGVSLAFLPLRDGRIYQDRAVEAGRAYDYFVRATNGSGFAVTAPVRVAIPFDICGPIVDPVPPPLPPPPPVQLLELLRNGDFSDGAAEWLVEGEALVANGPDALSPDGYAMLGVDAAGAPRDFAEGRLSRALAIPQNSTAARLEFALRIVTEEYPPFIDPFDPLAPPPVGHDFLMVLVELDDGTAELVAVLSDMDAFGIPGYRGYSFGLAQFAGRPGRLIFRSRSDLSLPTAFLLDDVSVLAN